MSAAYEPEDNGVWENFIGVEGDDTLWTLLSVYADGEATPEEAVQVAALLEETPVLAHDLAFLRQVSDGFGGIGELEPPLSLRHAILAATVERPTLRKRVLVAVETLRGALAPQPVRFALGGAVATGLLAVAFWPHPNKLTPAPAPGGVAQNDAPRPIAHTGARTEAGSPQVAQATQRGTSRKPASGASRLMVAKPSGSSLPDPLFEIAPELAAATAKRSSGTATVAASRSALRNPVGNLKNATPPANNTGRLLTAQIDSKEMPQPMPDLVPVGYRPKMDAAYQRNLQGTSVAMLTDTPDLEVSDSAPSAPMNPADTNSNDTTADAGMSAPRPKALVGRINLPPDVSGVPSLMELRRRREAAARGFDAVPEGFVRKRSEGTVVARF